MNDNDKFDAFDFIINEEDEVMLLLYAREGEAKDAVIEIDAGNRSAVLYRNEEDGVVIDRIIYTGRNICPVHWRTWVGPNLGQRICTTSL